MPDEIIPTAEEVAAKQKELEELEAKLVAMGKEIVDTKPLYKSKILWVNVLAMGAIVVNQVWGVPMDTINAVIAMALPIITIVLRYNAKDVTGVVS